MGNFLFFLLYSWLKVFFDVYIITVTIRVARNAPRSKAEKKKKVSLVKLKRTQKTRGEGLARVAYDAKSVEKFGGL